MSTQKIYTMNEGKKEDPVKALKTPFYQTASTGGSVWVIKPGQTLQKHRHNNSDDIWVVLQGQGIFYPEPDQEVPFCAGQVLVSEKGSAMAQRIPERKILSLSASLLRCRQITSRSGNSRSDMGDRFVLSGRSFYTMHLKCIINPKDRTAVHGGIIC